MEHLEALVSPSISSNRWRYLACKWSHCLMGICKMDEMHQGRDKWWYSHLDAYQCHLSLPWPLHPSEGLSCEVDVSPGYSLMQGKRVIHWLILHLLLPCGVIQMAREPSWKASLEPPFQWCGPLSCSTWCVWPHWQSSAREWRTLSWVPWMCEVDNEWRFESITAK